MEPYFYNARCTRVIDGDTAVVDISVGFDFKTEQKIRFLGVNTPERNMSGYKEATNFTTGKILGKDLIINTVEKDVFGRWLAYVYYPENKQMVSLNQQLLDGGYAVVYEK